MKISIDENLKGKELFNFLVENKTALIAQKKFEIKKGDAFSIPTMLVINKDGHLVKAEGNTVPVDADVIEVTSIINTTYWLDSHGDVHIDGLWKKSLKENKMLYLLQEHQMTFKGIIADADDIKAFTKKLSWKELGVEANGETEALVFVSKVKKSRNEFMFNEYRKGHVKNHSVGMRYVDIRMAINDSDYKEEFSNWNKWIDKIANKGDAEAAGYFFGVTEAKCVEGSPVPVGSNSITPTQSIKADTQNPEPDTSTSQEPSSEPEPFDLLAAIKETKFFT